MKCLKVKLFLLIILVCLAFASAAYALRPFIFGIEKAMELHHDVEVFRETARAAQQNAAPDKDKGQEETPPYPALRQNLLIYNNALYYNQKKKLDSKSAYEVSQFKLTDYGLPSEIFGVLTIPAMNLEMPLYLGANEENLANGAAVLSQTSIPIGGIGTNAVIAGHRGWNGYKYFMDIELLGPGDEIAITNLWETLTYQVVEIRIVMPNNVDAIMIRPDRDMITLLTCHPPNTGGQYRYLVYCERIQK